MCGGAVSYLGICSIYIMQKRVVKFTSMTARHEDSWLVARQARMTTPAATVEGLKQSLSWFRRDKRARCLDRFSTLLSAPAALR